MSGNEPPVYGHNFFVAGQIIFQAAALLLLPLMAASLALLSATVAWDFCSLQDCSSMARLGAIWSAMGFLYVLIEEVWKITPQSMHQEIEGSLALIGDDLPGAAEAKRKFRGFANFTEKARLPLVRTIEVWLVVGGTLLDGFGDLLARLA